MSNNLNLPLLDKEFIVSKIDPRVNINYLNRTFTEIALLN